MSCSTSLIQSRVCRFCCGTAMSHLSSVLQSAERKHLRFGRLHPVPQRTKWQDDEGFYPVCVYPTQPSSQEPSLVQSHELWAWKGSSKASLLNARYITSYLPPGACWLTGVGFCFVHMLYLQKTHFQKTRRCNVSDKVEVFQAEVEGNSTLTLNVFPVTVKWGVMGA